MSEVTRLPATGKNGSGSRSPAGTGKRKVIEHPGRFAIVAGGLTVVAMLVAGAIVSADTKDVRNRLPVQVVSVTPPQGAIVPPQATIAVDLRDDLTADLTLCSPTGGCVPIPADQVGFVPALGQLTFQPGAGKDIDVYQPGVNQVRVDYRSQEDPARDNGTYSWSFTVKA